MSLKSLSLGSLALAFTLKVFIEETDVADFSDGASNSLHFTDYFSVVDFNVPLYSLYFL